MNPGPGRSQAGGNASSGSASNQNGTNPPTAARASTRLPRLAAFTRGYRGARGSVNSRRISRSLALITAAFSLPIRIMIF